MRREYHKLFSPSLGREMEMLEFGHAGTPLLVFPTSMGRFFDYEDRGMMEAISGRVENGELHVFCADSVDGESWCNWSVPARDRILRHIQYESYLIHEAAPFLRYHSGADRIAVTGCGFGGYHSVNFALRHPALVHTCVSMGGTFDIHCFLGGYHDENAYFHCPSDYLPNLRDEWYLARYRNGFRLILAAGEHDGNLDANRHLAEVLGAKGIPHQLDVWGDGTGHDWHYWQRMARKFF